MKLSRLGQIIAVAWMFSGVAQAAEVQVPLGHGTLATAIADATEGDTLILGDGSYIGNGALVINKSLVIRSINRAASSYIVADSLTIDAADKSIVLQGLDFGVQVTVLAADDVKVLEGQFLAGVDLNVTEYKTTEGDGTLMVIGNHFAAGSLITTIHAFDAYIAGNTFDSGRLISNVPVWIVGNSISATNGNGILINTSGTVQILANRISFSSVQASGTIRGIDINAGTALVAGNIMELNMYSYSNVRFQGIYISSNSNVQVINNIVTRKAGTGVTGNGSYGIHSYASGTVSGNIVFSLGHSFIAIAGSGVENNLCFSNSYNNSCGSNAITTDPLLVDQIDYKLGTGSPAINAGSTNVMLADLDRTRNDIGAYGGPWSIGQYDAQRDPSYFGPYVYPLFKANASFVNGQMQIRAIGVARLR